MPRGTLWLNVSNVSDVDKQIKSISSVLTSYANVSTVYPESFVYRLKRTFLGRPFVTEQLARERICKPVAFGVLSPDCISSSANGAEQIAVAARDNFGQRFASVTVVAQLIDYTVTVTVTVQRSAGTAALTSGVSSVVHYTVVIGGRSAPSHLENLWGIRGAVIFNPQYEIVAAPAGGK